MAKALICELCDHVFKEYGLRKEVAWEKSDGQKRWLVLDVIYQCQHRNRRSHKPDICKNCLMGFLGDMVSDYADLIDSEPQAGPIWENEGDECSNQSVEQTSPPVTAS